MNLLVIVVDRLHIGFLGSYGNAWVGTPGIDAFAARGLVFDQAVIDTPRLGPLYTTYWQGVHAAAQATWRQRHPNDAAQALPARLAAAGYHTLLVSDDERVARHRLAAGFEQRLIPLPPLESRRSRSSLERLFTKVGRQLAECRPPFCLWVHSRGLGAPWDAPLKRRRQFAEVDDPLPPDTRDVPRLELPPDYDPDLLQGLRWAYAGQVTLLDDCLTALGGLLDEAGLAEDTAVLLLAPRGFPLGEHRCVGTQSAQAHEELIHVPWLWHLPGEDLALARCGALVQPDDLTPTIAALAGLPPAEHSGTGHNLLPLLRGEVTTVRDRAITVVGHRTSWRERSLRTAAWHYREQQRTSAAQRDLFVKPDDRWELNEISSRCEGVPEAMQTALDDWFQAAQTGQFDAIPPLPEGC